MFSKLSFINSTNTNIAPILFHVIANEIRKVFETIRPLKNLYIIWLEPHTLVIDKLQPILIEGTDDFGDRSFPRLNRAIFHPCNGFAGEASFFSQVLNSPSH